MNEVMLRMYSPALLPSRWRAAVAKKRIWSTIGGISSLRVRWIGLPVFSTSSAISSSARASTASAKRNSASDRSLGVLSRHVSNAAARSLHRIVDVGWPRQRRCCVLLAGGRIDHGGRAAIGRVDVLAVDEVLERLHASVSPCSMLASLRTSADLDLSDYGAQHELALRPSHATFGLQPPNEAVQTFGARRNRRSPCSRPGR